MNKYMIRWHEPQDMNHVNELAESMVANGWQGSPLVCWGDQLYTGAHRSKAAEIAGIDFPTIDIEEIFEEAGIDFEEVHTFNYEPTASDPSMSFVLGSLPEAIKDKYGIDIE